ncbi:ABC transporter ATP-binding protein [Brucella sp. BE17]|uniref:ABC transporter ATP-binding protein n=1 Tax=Brucella sp. BE17 TaxID=3142977 RepID=UPI0031BA3175
MSVAVLTKPGRPDSASRNVGPLAPIDLALDVQGLSVMRGNLRLVDNVSFSVRAGETLCLVGESGCGKSLTCMSLLGLHSAPLVATGSIKLFDQQIIGRPETYLNRIRGRDTGMIFQNPMVALNPIQRIGPQIEEVLRHHTDLSARARKEEVLGLLERVGIADPQLRSRAYPNQLSGGMCQRVMIAMAIACRPRLLIADEPTTALDVTIQAQILDLLRDLQTETGMAMVFVTHDLGVVAEIAHRVAVMYAGRIVEIAPVDKLFDTPSHPYTEALMDCRVGLAMQSGQQLAAIPGGVPSPRDRPIGCAFAPRCTSRHTVCNRPVRLYELAPMHWVACHARGVS